MNKFMKSYFILIFILIFSFKANCDNVEILNDIPGTGNEVVNHSKITVHYSGKLDNGTVFDSSYKRKQPFVFQIGTRQVIEGWELGIIGMKEGGKRSIFIPSKMAYGKKGAGDLIPPNSNLIFDIEIIKVEAPKYKILDVKDIKKMQSKGFKLIDIRNKNETDKTGIIPGSINITAFDKNGNFLNSFLEKYQSLVINTDNVVLISDKGDISSILANGFAEHLGAKNMYSLSGGIKAYLKFIEN
tara:strand:- start:1179 stop:1907 length:729 start_codon:yes stop_codon:yes gene_type:complete